MTINRRKLAVVIAIAAGSLTGCAKKAASVSPSAPQPAPAAETRVSQPAPVQASAPRQGTPEPAKPKPDYPDAATRKRIDELLAKLEDAYFDYDKASLRADAI